MNWFEEQLRKRKENDEQLLETAFAQAAGIVYGQKTADAFLNERFIAKRAIDEILKYYHLSCVDIPEKITDSREQLAYCLRQHGVMKRRVILHDGWYRNAYGVMLTHRKESGEPVVLLPDKLGRHYHFCDRSGDMKWIDRHTAALFEEEAYCFYKPLPHGKLAAKDLLLYIRDCIQTKDWLYLVLCVLLMTVVGLLIPQTVRVLTAEVAASQNTALLKALGASLLCTVLSVQLIGTVAGGLVQKIKGKIALTVHSALMMRILSLPASLFEAISPGELAGSSAAVDELCEQLISVTAGTGLAALASLLYIVQIFVLAPPLGVPSLVILLITFILGFLMAVIRTRLGNRQMERSGNEARVRYSMIKGIQKIRLSGAEKRFFAKWLREYTVSRRLTYSPPFLVRAGGVLTLAVNLFSTIMLYHRAAASGISQPDYIAFAVAFSMVLGAIHVMADSFLAAGRLSPTLKMLDVFLQAEPETAGNRQLVTDLNGAVELNNVYFRYSANAPYILRNVSLKIRPKEYVAIVGKTGCGKSTLIKLLLGLRSPERGAVYYGGQDLNTLDLSTLRSKIGTVMQNGELFQGTIFENITISAPQATLEDAWTAAEIAGIADDIRAMPMGMHTLVSTQGGISGGQKQRILIARAIVAKPKILIFDEATSALDNITQRQISDALDSMGCTRIVIAHRLSTIRHCDRIIVLEHGSIAEEGSYEGLIAKDGIFADLVRRQIAG